MNSVLGDLPPEVAVARIGFFWIVDDAAGLDVILAEAIAIGQGEVYGPSVVHPGGHFHFWSKMQKGGPAWLRARGLSAALLATEYEEWPRGRVSLSLESKRLMLLIDPRLRTQMRIAMIQREFGLPDGHLDLRSDGHYRPVKLGRSERW